MLEETEARKARSSRSMKGRKRRIEEMGREEEDPSSPFGQVSCCRLGVERNLKTKPY